MAQRKPRVASNPAAVPDEPLRVKRGQPVHVPASMPAAPPPAATDDPDKLDDPDNPEALPSFLPLDADAPEYRRDPAPMRALVETVIRRLNLPGQELWREELDAVWQRVVPAAIAAAIHPGKWEQGVLYLYVANSTQLFEIRRLHLRTIEALLRQRFGPTRLRQVRLQVNPD